MANRKRSDDLLIAALARGSTQRDAAVVAGVSERTVHRRMSDPTSSRDRGRSSAKSHARQPPAWWP